MPYSVLCKMPSNAITFYAPGPALLATGFYFEATSAPSSESS